MDIREILSLLGYHEYEISNDDDQCCDGDNDLDELLNKFFSRPGDCCDETPSLPRKRPRHCRACNKVVGGPHMDLFNQLFRELAEDMRNHAQQGFFRGIPPHHHAWQQQQRSRQSNPASQPKLTIYEDPEVKGKYPVIAYVVPGDVKENAIPSAFLCPIRMDIMKDPIVMSDGHSYEREAILEWVNVHGKFTSPCTRKPFAPLVGFYNFNLASAIREWVENAGGKVVMTHEDVAGIV